MERRQSTRVSRPTIVQDGVIQEIPSDFGISIERKYDTSVHVASLRVHVRWDHNGRKEFRRAINASHIASREEKDAKRTRIGIRFHELTDGRIGDTERPTSIWFHVEGTVKSLQKLLKMSCVLETSLPENKPCSGKHVSRKKTRVSIHREGKTSPARRLTRVNGEWVYVD